MRFIDVSGTLARARRFVSFSQNVSEDEVQQPNKLAEILRAVLRRMSELEARTPPEGIEFEVEVGTLGALTTMQHNLNSGVRFTIVYWTKVRAGTTYPTTAPILIADETSDLNKLVVRSYVAGRAVVRIEPTFKGITQNAS